MQQTITWAYVGQHHRRMVSIASDKNLIMINSTGHMPWLLNYALKIPTV